MREFLSERKIADHCADCGGRREATYHVKDARFTVLLPARCPRKDDCEAALLNDLQITPARDSAGQIVR